jgi:hypothetical protein
MKENHVLSKAILDPRIARTIVGAFCALAAFAQYAVAARLSHGQAFPKSSTPVDETAQRAVIRLSCNKTHSRSGGII